MVLSVPNSIDAIRATHVPQLRSLKSTNCTSEAPRLVSNYSSSPRNYRGCESINCAQSLVHLSICILIFSHFSALPLENLGRRSLGGGGLRDFSFGGVPSAVHRWLCTGFSEPRSNSLSKAGVLLRTLPFPSYLCPKRFLPKHQSGVCCPCSRTRLTHQLLGASFPGPLLQLTAPFQAPHLLSLVCV